MGSTSKLIYKKVTEEEALQALDQIATRWGDEYPQISRSRRGNWKNLSTLFNYPEDIRRAIYTTNTIESLNSVIRKVIKRRKPFPADDLAKSGLPSNTGSFKKMDHPDWKLETGNWKTALKRFMIEFDGRLRTSFKQCQLHRIILQARIKVNR